jgi:hypothetical protein
VRRYFPNAFIVGRRFAIDQPLDNPCERGHWFADFVAEKAVPAKGAIDAWQSYNEVVGHNDYAAYELYNQFQVCFAERLQGQYGIAAVAGNDASGTVEPDDYPKYFADAIRASMYFGMHAYAPPRSKSMKDDAEWNVLRYRKVHDALENAGITGVQIVLTETGLHKGWQGVISSDDMVDEFMWLTRELEQDPYIIGQAAFGIFGDGDWEEFDLMQDPSMIDALGEYEPGGPNPYWVRP